MRATKQQGFSMLEVLVSIVILSFGLLGVAGMQAAALRYNQTAYLRSIATQLAYDVSDRMRGNLVGVRNAAYSCDVSYGTASTAGCGVDRGCTSASCSYGYMAETDLYHWSLEARRVLPGGGVAVQGNTQSGYTITVMWKEKDMDSSATDGNCTSVSGGAVGQVRCFKTVFLP